MNGKRATLFLVINVVALLQAARSIAGGFDCDRILNYNSSVMNGQISSPRYPLPYPTNISCTWTIRSPPKTYIGLVIKRISIRSSPHCVDRVTVTYAGPSPHIYCYSSHWGSSYKFYSPNNEMMVKFNAGPGNDTEHQGFLASFSIFQAVCPKPENRTSLSGRLMSPNYYHNYPGNLTCQWVVRVPQGYRIHLYFSTVKLAQKTHLCKNDYIIVMDGAGFSVHVMKRFCDETFTHFFSSGNTMTVRFVSDVLFTNKGFYASYRALPTPTVSSTPSKQTPMPDFLPDNLNGVYEGYAAVVVMKDHSYIKRLKVTSNIACVLKCQQILGCTAATFSCHGDGIGGLCTLYDSRPQHKAEKSQQIPGDVYFEQVRSHVAD